MKMVESLAEKYIKKGMHLGDNLPEKGVFGRYKITLKEFLVEHNCIIHNWNTLSPRVHSCAFNNSERVD